MKNSPEMEKPLNANERFLHHVAIRLDVIIEQNNSIIEHLAKNDNVAVTNQKVETKRADYNNYPVSEKLEKLQQLSKDVLATDEIAIYTLVIALGVAFMIYLFFFGIISIHEYGLVQCLLTILFTIVAALIVIFFCLLFFDLLSRVFF